MASLMVKKITNEPLAERNTKLKLIKERFKPAVIASFNELLAKNRLGKILDAHEINWDSKPSDYHNKVRFSKSFWELFEEERLQFFPLNDIPNPKTNKLEALQALYKRFNGRTYGFRYSRDSSPTPYYPRIRVLKPNEKTPRAPPPMLQFEIILEWKIKA